MGRALGQVGGPGEGGSFLRSMPECAPAELMPRTTNAGPEVRADKPKLVVGIGASAGGLDACKRFLAAMPPDSGMAIVIIMHLAPSRESHIAEIFRASTTMEVVQVSAPRLLMPDHVYVIVPDTSLELKDGVLYPNKPHDPHGQRHPVDALFSSLAEDQKEIAVGVVLSGTGNNGSSGIRSIKARGGLCLVQSPETAEYDGMPQNAIATGAGDYVLPPEEMPKILLEYAEHPDALRPGEGGAHEAEPGEAFDLILDLLSRIYRVNFRSSYKRGTLERRTNRRMGLKQVSDWRAYLEVLQGDPKEVAALYGDLLIGVTQFFRNPDVWEHIKTEVLPGLLAQQDGETPLKFWVSGCATGEEAYTLAIIVLEQLERSGRSTKVQIFATDAAENELAFARQGVYPSSIREVVSPERLSRFFRQEGENFEIGRNVRDMVTFAVHNLLGDPPFSKIDLVSCRNVLIYLEGHAQQRVLELFHFALKPGGLLLLGGSETVGQHANLFETVSQKTRVYRSTATTEAARHLHLHWAVERALRGVTGAPASAPSARKDPKVSRIIEQIVLSRYTWACVAVTESFEIQSFWGPTHQYLMQPTGEARMDLLTWAKPGIYPRLRTALERAREGKERVTVTDMRVERDGVIQRVECSIEPITPLPGEARLFLVSFRDVPHPPTVEVTEAAESGEPLVRQLEAENKDLREELQSTVEQLESTNGEYRASHEELLSLNEELQSNNEELQASKEELQSLNEEMVTVNRQLEDRNVELRSITADLNNLLVSTDIPIIFLDRELRVRRFMPAATQLMHLVPSDVGRSVEHIKERFDDAGMIRDAQTVLEKLVPITTEVETEHDRWYMRTVRPYRTEDDRIDGVCIAFFEITKQKKAAEQHADARQFAETLVAESPAALLVVDPDLRVVTATESFCKTFRVSKAETEGVHLYDLGNRQWDIPRLRQVLEQILPEKAEVRDYEVSHDFEQLGRRVMRVHARRMSRGDFPPYILLNIEDLTECKTVEEALKVRADELTRENERRNEFLAMLGHELRNPLSAMTHGLDLLALVREDAARLEEIRRMMARQARRLGSMLDQLLDVARVTSGKIQMAKVLVDLAEAVQAAVEAVTPLVEAHKHELAVSVPPGRGVIVQGDLARLTQVVENLLNNAAKYTEDGGKINLTIESDEDWVRLRVRDTGIGMDAELLPHIFELFTQGPRTLDRSAGGLGLGLPLVKRVVEMHGGSVEASSPGRGQGSAFVVTLPRMLETWSRERTEGADTGVRPGNAPSRRVLVVEDEEDTRTALAEFLVEVGHEAVAVRDGPAALETARSFHPDAVLLDLGLPKMDGYEVARQLREEHKGEKILIVAVSGYGSDADRLKQAGFDRHLIKPPNMQKLFAWLAAIQEL